MPELRHYRWPTKLKKFGIVDPFLKTLVCKYENEIPWQDEVRDAESLIGHVEKNMLPTFKKRVAYPDCLRAKNHFYISSSDVSLDTALQAEQIHGNAGFDTLKAIETLRETHGDLQATDALVDLINQRKFHAFQAWAEFLETKYPNHAAFRLLMMRSLFELAKKGVRRAVIHPSPDIVDWLYRRIETGRVLPDENIAKQYCIKLGLSSLRGVSNGWQFISSGELNAPTLSAACRGSGWCVAAIEYASNYLIYNEFYILKVNDKPVVALRVAPSEQGGRVLECRGRCNSDPDEWLEDIAVFMNTQSLSLYSEENNFYGFYPKLASYLSLSPNYADKPDSWWADRIKLWPFSLKLAPKQIQNYYLESVSEGVFQFSGFKNFGALVKSVGINLDISFWRLLIEATPTEYPKCPAVFQSSSIIQEACYYGWLSLIEEGQLTLAMLPMIPEFVKNREDVQRTIDVHILPKVRAQIRKHPTTYIERISRFNMQNAFPANQDDTPVIAQERLVNVLLNNQDGVFSDQKFSEPDRQRDDFSQLRKQAWFEAMQSHPPLWFALPKDLINCERFKTIDKFPGNVDIENWSQKVTEKPWILLNKSGVPKSLRLHSRILQAYQDGWLSRLRREPWKIWVSFNPRRAYMSYALLADHKTIAVLTDGWIRQEKNIVKCWFTHPSDRMRDVPALQIAILQAVIHLQKTGTNHDTVKICKDITTRWKSPGLEWVNRYVNDEVRALLGDKIDC